MDISNDDRHVLLVPRGQCTKVKTSLGRAQRPHRRLESAAAHLGPSGTRRRRRSCFLAWWSQIGCLPPSEADSPQKACRAQLNGLTNVARSHMLPHMLPGHLCCRSARCDLATWHVSAQRAYVDQADLAAALSSMGSPGLFLCCVLYAVTAIEDATRATSRTQKSRW